MTLAWLSPHQDNHCSCGGDYFYRSELLILQNIECVTGDVGEVHSTIYRIKYSIMLVEHCCPSPISKINRDGTGISPRIASSALKGIYAWGPYEKQTSIGAGIGGV